MEPHEDARRIEETLKQKKNTSSNPAQLTMPKTGDTMDREGHR